MQKFRNYIFSNDDIIKTYIGQISKIRNDKIVETYEKTTYVDGGGNIFLANLNTGLEEKKSSIVETSISEIEKLIDYVSDNNNAINYMNEDLDSNKEGCLIKMTGEIAIPEMVENLELLNSIFKNEPLAAKISLNDEDKEKLTYIKESNNVPIIVEKEKYAFVFLLNRNNLKITIDDFFDGFGDKVTLIGKIENVYNSNDEVEIFDMLKEVLKLNRLFRREMPKEYKKNTYVYYPGPLVKVTPLIIYK